MRFHGLEFELEVKSVRDEVYLRWLRNVKEAAETHKLVCMKLLPEIAQLDPHPHCANITQYLLVCVNEAIANIDASLDPAELKHRASVIAALNKDNIGLRQASDLTNIIEVHIIKAAISEAGIPIVQSRALRLLPIPRPLMPISYAAVRDGLATMAVPFLVKMNGDEALHNVKSALNVVRCLHALETPSESMLKGSKFMIAVGNKCANVLSHQRGNVANRLYCQEAANAILMDLAKDAAEDPDTLTYARLDKLGPFSYLFDAQELVRMKAVKDKLNAYPREKYRER